ncbi:hypothetical protein Fot_11382 [Forsythia ovata]|uniref:Uncharacterized protein n=1 Tax=Forsythia ovata TaxID=205694 RepID=A0ABD1WJI3_9LAMI
MSRWGDLSSLSFEAFVRSSEDIDHQGKRKGVAVDEGKNVAPKRTLGDKGDASGSVRFKRSRIAPPQETTRLIPASPKTVQGTSCVSDNQFSNDSKDVCNAQKKAELKLKVFEDMAYAKNKELTQVLTELSKAKELLAKL